MTYKNEPQSYTGKPPGLSTRLFLKLGFGGRESFCVLIYPASGPWLATSSTALELYDANGVLLETAQLAIACSGSAIVLSGPAFRRRHSCGKRARRAMC